MIVNNNAIPASMDRVCTSKFSNLSYLGKMDLTRISNRCITLGHNKWSIEHGDGAITSGMAGRDDAGARQNILLNALVGLQNPFPHVAREFDPERCSMLEEFAGCYRFVCKGDKQLFDGSVPGLHGHVFSERAVAMDMGAYPVGQDEVAFGRSIRMGVSNVQSCIALIVKDIGSGETALYHAPVTVFGHPHSLAKTIEAIATYLPGGKKEVVMIGGVQKESEAAIKVVLDVFLGADDEVSIKKAYVRDPTYYMDSKGRAYPIYELNTSSGTFVVDTSDLTIRCAQAGKEHAHKAFSLYSNGGTSAIDFTRDP